MMQHLKARQGFSFALAFALLFGVFLMGQKDSVYAVHVPQHYDYEYSHQNLYDRDVLLYSFTNLDVTQQYNFTLQALDIETGGSSINLQSFLVGPGVATAVVAWGTFLDSWSQGSHFPMQVIDNFGQILGRHFLTPIYTVNGAWDTAGGSVLIFDKQAVAGSIYNIRNGFGYQHDPILFPTPLPSFVYTTSGGFGLDVEFPLNSIVTQIGDYILLHYQREVPHVETTDKIQIKDIGTGVLLAEFILSELDCFSKNDPTPTFGEVNVTYIVLSTDGVIPLWSDEARINTCFTSSTNPSSLTLPSSAYSYGRVTTADVLKDEGESVLLVTSDPSLSEWSITGRTDPVRDGREQRIDRRQYTETIHDGYPLQEIFDDGLGSIDSTNYDFAPFRTGVYTPNFASVVFLTWQLESSDLLFGQVTAEFRLEIQEIFEMIIAAAPTSRTELFQRALKGFNLDNDTGSMLLLIVFTLLGFMLAHAMRAPAFIYPMVYLVVAGFLIFLGIFSPSIQLLVGLSAFATVLLIFVTPFLMEEKE